MPRANRSILCSALACALALGAVGAPTTPTTQPRIDLGAYRSVLTAITAKPQAASKTAGQPPYLGIAATTDAKGRIVVQSVDPASPAADAGLKTGDILLRAGAPVEAAPATTATLGAHDADSTLETG